MEILEMYNKLYKALGPQHWWPGDSPFEIIVGAVLTQNTNWGNVEKAINNLKAFGVLSLESIYSLDINMLAEYIRPAGYYNIKAKRLKSLVKFIKGNCGGVDAMLEENLSPLRAKLLGVYGLGPETVDSILLYAGNKPVFVVDAYTKRIFSRHGLCYEDTDYHQLQDIITSRIPKDIKIYNEFHALIVKLGKEFCKKTNPLCEKCPINEK